jgi:hypothetical protein
VNDLLAAAAEQIGRLLAVAGPDLTESERAAAEDVRQDLADTQETS